MPTVTRVTTYDHEIRALFLPGGDGWGWMRQVGTEQLYLTIGMAPVRSGELASSFKLSLTPFGSNVVRYTVGSYAEHSWFVQNGTRPIIWGDGSFMAKSRRLKGGKMSAVYPLMWVRPQPHSWYPNPTARRFVRGQAANPFITDAANIIILRYR